MNNYKIKKIYDDTWLINDDAMCTVYVIKGSKKTLIIDTGNENNNNLIEEIKKITNNELVLVLTHTHLDHLGHLNEFEHYYLSKYEDLTNITLNKATLFDNEYVFDLGNKIIKAIVFPAHTKGSTILIDEANKANYTGDQFGSGCGVWMQVNEATTLSTYIDSITKFLNYLDNNYSFDKHEFTLWGGHYGQELTSRLSSYNPLNIDMVLNMKTLCEKILNKEIILQECNSMVFNNEISLYASYKNAEIVTRKSLVK